MKGGLPRALVIRGSGNVFTLRPLEGGGRVECRLRDQAPGGQDKEYEPPVPGDLVRFEPDPRRPGTGLIAGLEERRNLFARSNRRGRAPRLLAANMDLILCVTTPSSPPFRPRFLDRVLAQAEAAGIPPLIVCNKYDLSRDDPDVEERLEDYGRIGYRTFRLSARTGEGLPELRALMAGKCSLLLGQSGVGKSSLAGALGAGALNEKDGPETRATTAAALVEAGDGTRVIDTPGIRRFVPYGVEPGDLIFRLREFAPLAGSCRQGLSCSHQTEPGCKIMEAVAAGVIHEDRYESFLRIRDELEGRVSGD